MIRQEQENYDFSGSQENEAPPPSGVSKPDYDLSTVAITFGNQLRIVADLQDSGFFRGCEQWAPKNNHIGQWIRANLKE